MLVFDVFGRRIGVVREGGEWVTIELGTEGKHRSAKVSIPKSVPEDGLLRYLADHFHESARPTRPDVVFLGRSDDAGASS